ncbi:hypothetical protein [Xanthocytophaga agilis]|uniref:Uncharacterized protein n=1 Tax=Xanthocytophaga agilis TaxID=3048010 RepID=A0AAE3R2V4_9BACT|nr:hypothetical protein [Xanthocytophaga agilis]MDJ1499672.1 hypothetical protein [Xanthocytophaga agilis]
MNHNLLFTLLLIASPVVSAFLASVVTYRYLTRAQKREYLYQHRYAAYKELSFQLIGLRKYCLDKISEGELNAFYHSYTLDIGSAQYQNEIVHVVETNAMFLSNSIQTIVQSVVDKLSLLCKAETVILGIANENEKRTYYSFYPIVLTEIEKCLQELSAEIEL